MKITIITDGNNKLGLGHVYQSLTLANAIRDKSNNSFLINFITKSDEKILKFIRSFKYDAMYLDNDDLIFNKLESDKPDRVIFDKLDVSARLALKIKKILQIKLIISTNLTKANRYADVMIFPGFQNNFTHCMENCSIPNRINLVGLRYLLLRPEFYIFKNKCKIYNDSINNIMLIFGGSDPSNMTSFVLNTLLQIDAEYNIMLILGASFNHDQILNEVLIKNKHSRSNVNILRNIANIAEEMYRNDLVFTSPGLSFFESLVVGTPVVSFHQNESQRVEYADILPTLGVEDLDKIPLIMKDKKFIFPYDSLIQSMEIGEGKNEILNAILN